MANLARIDVVLKLEGWEPLPVKRAVYRSNKAVTYKQAEDQTNVPTHAFITFYEDGEHEILVHGENRGVGDHALKTTVAQRRELVRQAKGAMQGWLWQHDPDGNGEGRATVDFLLRAVGETDEERDARHLA